MATARVGTILAGLALVSVALAADEAEPELDFLEYLGMWEETDEDWQLFAEEAGTDSEEQGETSTDDEAPENDDES